jgi:glycosyltransferase involved in cell wall biosynthesis
MNDIQKVLNLLRNMRPTAKELVKVKVLIAGHGEWQTLKSIRDKASLHAQKKITFKDYVAQGLLEKERQAIYKKGCGTYYRDNYRTSGKGVKYVSQLMR